ncbi:glycosyltransferase family 1 protein [Massilia sp. erpn]|uniref:glycosyltransferase family 4 protein n=1 Tax=Massilia sp. erpn TaxID=2738142 RepID=UPI002104B8C2|nr:glycosyltransferase family 1 protein [Massilia sp. erpn]
MSALRTGLSCTTIEPGLNGGRLDGIGVYSQALLRHLPAAGCAVQPYSFGPAARLTAGRPLPLSFAAATLRDLATPSAVRQKMGLDLYHATDYRIVRMDCPVVATLHDALPIAHPEWCSPKQRRLKNWLQIKAAHKANHVIAVSQFAVAELVQCFGVDERRISVVHNGVDESWFTPPPAERCAATLAAHGLRPGYFLFVGTLQPRKNVERLLQAYLGLPPVLRAARQLVIVGAPGWRSEALQARIAAAVQQGENVRWLERLTSQEALRDLYAGAGALIYPSLYEGFGIPLLEAFASRLPVVASNTTSLPEVTLGAALEVDPLSVSGIGAAMLDIVRDEALRERCIAAGERRALELTWAETARRTAAVYHSILLQ